MSKIFLLWKEIEFKKLNKLISSLKEEETFDIKNQNFILNSLYSIKPE
jgi:hypothetical protein